MNKQTSGKKLSFRIIVDFMPRVSLLDAAHCSRYYDEREIGDRGVNSDRRASLAD